MTTITPNQIRPGANGSVVGTTSGQTKTIELVAGAGISISVVGDTIVISSTVVAPFSITSFSGAQVVELGATVTNPTFAATYSSLPDSASITNTDGTDSPHVLTTPFTSATITGGFTKTAQVSVTFTLTALQGAQTSTAAQAISWKPAIFGGIGAPGATSSVTATGTTAVLSTGDALARAQVGNETVGETFGPYSPSGVSVYLLLTGGSHTFVDAGTGLPMAFNSPTAVSFVNDHGVTVSMFLYQSTNILFGTYTPKVAS